MTTVGFLQLAEETAVMGQPVKLLALAGPAAEDADT
jgi:hypothetical protein